MEERRYNCYLCDAINDSVETICRQCGEPTTIALLVSLGSGNVPKGFVWPLYPYDMEMGSSTSSDVVVPSNRLSKKHCQLGFKKGSFYLKRTDEASPVFNNSRLVQTNMAEKLQDGAVIRAGLDEMKLFYHNLSERHLSQKTEKERVKLKIEKEQSINPVTKRLMLILGYLQELHSSMTIEDLMASSVDAVLKITGLDRGYAFLVQDVDGTASLKEVISRKIGGMNLGDSECNISRSLLTDVMQGSGAVIIEDADQGADSTDSVRDFNIKSMVCLPLVTKPKEGEGELVGIIYADKLLSRTKLPSHTRTTLQMLSQLIVANLGRCGEYMGAVSSCNEYNTYFHNIADEFDTITENLGVIGANLSAVKDLAAAKEMSEYLKGEQQKLVNIIHSVVEASEE